MTSTKERFDALLNVLCPGNASPWVMARVEAGAQDQAEAYAALIAAAPKMYDALAAVNRLIAEAAMTGFNCHDGDWAQRLYDSQQETSTALREAGLRPPQAHSPQDDTQKGIDP